MKENKIMHSKISGIEIQLKGYCQETNHFHPEIELLYVVQEWNMKFVSYKKLIHYYFRYHDKYSN